MDGDQNLVAYCNPQENLPSGEPHFIRHTLAIKFHFQHSSSQSWTFSAHRASAHSMSTGRRNLELRIAALFNPSKT
jgi:hypothetical protein